MAASKYPFITELYRRTGVAVTRNPQSWQSFLSSACHNYKCRFDEQLLIFAQRPDATAVLELEDWNKKFKRWVNKDSKGIAVFDPKGRRNTLKYYFDISDTHEGYYNSRPVPIWQMNDRYGQAVMERLSDRFGDIEGNNLADALIQTANHAVEDNLPDYLSQLKDYTQDSFLEELDDLNTEVTYRRLAANSVAYMLMSRCGLDAGEYFDTEDFVDIINFNTPDTLNAIGIATSDISEMALKEISFAVRNVQMAEKSQNRTVAGKTANAYDKGRKQPERSDDNERNHLHQAGGLSYSRPDITNRARNSAWQIRPDAQGLSGAEQAGNVPEPADSGQTERTSLRGGADSPTEVRTDDEAVSTGTGRDGGTEGESPDAVGRADEHLEEPSRGSDTERADLPLSAANEDGVTANLPTVDEQIQMMVEAEDEKSSAFSVSQEDIDSVLVRGSGFVDGKYRIYRQFQKYEDSKANIAFLKKEYGTGSGTHIFPDGSRGHAGHDSKGISIDRNGIDTNHDLVLKWSQVEKRLRELIQNDRYLNQKEKDHYPDYLEKESAPRYEIDTQRKIARQRFIDSNRDLAPADKRDTLSIRLSDFIRDLDGYEKNLLENVELTELADVTAGQMEQHLKDPAATQKLIDFLALVQGQTSSVFSRSNAWRFGEELKELHPLHYLYHEGDTVYIGADTYEVLEVTGDMVSLRNAEFPLFGKEFSREDFEEKLRENPANEHLKVVVTEAVQTETPTEKKPDNLQLSIGFSEHPAFYDREFNDRYTNLSFALGNKLLGVLDEKQNRERETDNVGWYHKTDFKIIATVGGEEYNYDGRFDIGDGEGDLIVHIKNYYDYSLSPDCPFISEWKKQGEDFYTEKLDGLKQGRELFIPFLEQHSKLTPEDDRLFGEIMATENEWFALPEEEKAADEPDSRVDEMIAYAERVAAEQETEPPEERFKVTLTSDAFPDLEDAFAIWDNIRDEYYANADGKILTYATEEEAITGLDEVKKFVAEKEAEEWLYVERAKQGLEPALSEPNVPEDNTDLIGREITVDNRRYVIESIGKISNDVSLRDVTFQNNVGFPINRVEKLPRVLEWLKAQEEIEILSEEKTIPIPTATADRYNYRITDDSLGVGGAKEKFRGNMAAINLLHDLEIESRLATPEEQVTLSKYVGWGGLSQAFDEKNAAWANEFKELYTVLSPEEYRAAMESTLTAFYTPPVVIKAMYEALDNLGFAQGNVLEPSCGTGNFFGLLPESMAKSKLHGIEIDSLTGRIAKQLYQKSTIAIQGFEDTKLPDDHFDVVMGNVPFGDFKVSDSRYDKHKFLIHDYFFAKALDKARAGGVVMFITSKGTMDKENPLVRRYIAQRAELLGAIRLPNNTFKSNAGTEITADILILQKRDQVIDAEPDWVHLNKDDNGITMNSYFVEHPEMVLGDMVMESSRFGIDSACKPHTEESLEQLLSEAVKNISGEIPEYDIDEISDEQDNSIPADPAVKNFSFALVNGKVYFRENDRMNPATSSLTAENRIKGLVEIRDCVRHLIAYQTEDYPEEMIRTEQENLNRLYDAFTEKYGLINNRGNYLAFAADESYFLLCSLEVLDDEGNFKRKADMFSKRTIKPHTVVTSVETASEALALSIGEKARIDLDYMEQLTGKPQEEIIGDLEGVIFRVPNSDPEMYVTADEYLSGNVRVKLQIAQEAAKTQPDIGVNVTALTQVIPKDLSAGEISVRLGATWIPQEDIQQFVMELLSPSQYAADRIKVRYTPMNGDWFIENKGSDYGNVKAGSTYGTKRASAYRIIEDTLNLRDVRIFDYVLDEHGNKKAVFNRDETTKAQAKQEIIKQAFVDWLWKDPERRNRLVRSYNDTFNSTRPREYDGSHITFGGISPEITLRPHQVNAIAHILYGGNSLLAHKVGAGKTFEMVAAAQESKRLGLCQKSMFVVPNHLVGQWASEYLRLYPSANILVATKQDFETVNRKKFCGRIATGDYDAVIIGHSQFEKIPMSLERQYQMLEQQLDDIENGIDDIKASNGEQFTVKQLMKTHKAIKAKLDKLNDTKRKDNVIDFEELGVDRLYIDESHFYKNLYLYTKMRNVGGIAQTEAQKSSDLFMKCRYLDEITGNRGTIFATGTPISNSMVEMYSVQRYLQYDALARNGLQHFDAWASTFGETVTSLELAPEGTSYRAKTRFAKFYNLPELMSMFKEVADIQTADMLNLPVPKVNYHNIKVKPSEIQSELVASLAKRAEKVRARLVEPNIDNMLKITNDGRKLALDQRLIDPMLPDDENSKVNACVDNVYRIWENNADTKATQLAFCDLSTPKNDGSFNVYDNMREKLVQRGIPAEQIRFIHEANTDAQKKELFAKVRSGEVRVLLGSTQKMGAGTNVQDRLIAIHNLDCPWRPSDLEQRQGRIERQGNPFPEVEVYRYVTEQTFDAYLYQMVEGKQKFISQIMTSKSPVRSAEDVDEVALSFAEVKMLATGDVRFKEKMDLDIQVSKLRVLKQSYLSERYELEDKIIKFYPQEIKAYEERITGYESDKSLAEQHKPQGEDKFCPMTINGTTYTEKADAGERLLAVCKETTATKPIPAGSYRGFRMEVYYDAFYTEYRLNLCGKLKHQVSLGSDVHGNLTRIENELSKIPAKFEAARTKYTETIAQLDNAKVEVQKSFPYEDELNTKSERLNKLNIELNLDKKEPAALDAEPEKTDEPPARNCADRER